MADEVVTARLEEKAKNPGIMHRLAVFGTAMAKEVGAGTLSIPGYLGDLAALAISGQSTTWGDSMKQGIVNGAGWAGKKVGIEGPDILDETDQGLAVWGERAGVGVSVLAGGAGLLKGGTKLATKAGGKLLAREADDVVKAGAKTAASTADDAAKAGAKASEKISWSEALDGATTAHTRQSLKWNKKIATYLDAAADMSLANQSRLTGVPIWVGGKYASNWLAHPYSMAAGHYALGVIDGWAFNSTLSETAGKWGTTAVKETAKFIIPDHLEPSIKEAAKQTAAQAEEKGQSAINYGNQSLTKFFGSVAETIGIKKSSLEQVTPYAEKILTPKPVRTVMAAVTTGQQLQQTAEEQKAEGETPDAQSVTTAYLSKKLDDAKEKFEGASETLQQRSTELTAGGAVTQNETAGSWEDAEIPAAPAPPPGAESQPRPAIFARAGEKGKKLKETFGGATEAAQEKLKQEREKLEQDMREQKETMLARMHEKEADLEKKFEERKAQLEQAGRQVVDTTKGVAMAGMLPDLGGAFRGAGKWLKELDLGLDAKQMGMAAVGVGMLFALGKWAFGGGGNNAPASSGGGSSTMETVGTVLGALALVAMAAMVYDAVKGGGGKGETAPRNDRTLAALPAPAPQ